MKNIPCLILALSLAAAASSPGAEVRDFKDVKGRAFKATPVVVRGANITLKKDGGQEVAVPIKSLSAEDQAWVLNWISFDPKSLAYNFACTNAEKAGETMKTKSLLTKMEATPRGYEVKITNRCQNAIDGVKVAYRIFSEDKVDETGDLRTAVKVNYHAGFMALPKLACNVSHSISTKKLVCEKISPTSYGWVEKVVRDRLRGVWLKFYRHGELVGEWKSHGVPKCEWPGEAGEAQELQDDMEAAKEAAEKAAVAEGIAVIHLDQQRPAVIGHPEVHGATGWR